MNNIGLIGWIAGRVPICCENLHSCQFFKRTLIFKLDIILGTKNWKWLYARATNLRGGHLRNWLEEVFHLHRSTRPRFQLRSWLQETLE